MAAYKRHIDTANISELTISRLSIYLRCVDQLLEFGVETVSSQDLATRLNLNPAQIRKDLAYFGEFRDHGSARHLTPKTTGFTMWSLNVTGSFSAGQRSRGS